VSGIVVGDLIGQLVARTNELSATRGVEDSLGIGSDGGDLCGQKLADEADVSQLTRSR